MLYDDAAAVDAHDLVVGEGIGNGLRRLFVEVGLGIGGIEHRAVDDEEVGVGGWQTLVAVVYRAGHGQPQQAVAASGLCAQRAQLLFHLVQFAVLRVVLVVASHIEQRVGRSHTHEGVDMSIGVVAYEVAIVDPHYAPCVKAAFQCLFYLVLCHGLVAPRSEEATRGGEHRSLAVALYRASFEHEVVVVNVCSPYHSLTV